MRSLRSSRLVLSATSGLGFAGTRRRGGAGGIGACCSPGPCRMNPPGPIERYCISELVRCGEARATCGAAEAAVVSFGASALGAAGFGEAAAGAAFFTSFSSPGLTGEGRCSSPRRCALPITALRLTPPSSSAIWLAVAPSCHIFFRRSMRSSVQDILKSLAPNLPGRSPADRRLIRERPSQQLGALRTRQTGAQGRQLGRPSDPLYQGGEAVLQGPDADRLGAGDHYSPLSCDLHRRAGPRREDGDGGAVRRFHRAWP